MRNKLVCSHEQAEHGDHFNCIWRWRVSYYETGLMVFLKFRWMQVATCTSSKLSIRTGPLYMYLLQ